MDEPRKCCRPGCNNLAVVTLTFVYAESTAVLGPLAVVTDPHSWDICVTHSENFSAPKGWNLVRSDGKKGARSGYESVKMAVGSNHVENTDTGDITALAEAVLLPKSKQENNVHSAQVAPVIPKKQPGRRGHLRILPDQA